MNILKTVRTMGFLKILLWIIVISFVGAMFTLWGGFGDVEKKGATLFGRDFAVEVGKDYYPPEVFRLQYRFYVEQVKSFMGDNFQESFLKGAPKNIANQMARQLIEKRMAQGYGLSVSDEELADAIQRIYRFKDPKAEYPVLLQRLGVSAEQFQEYLRNDLLTQKLNDLLADSVYMSDPDIQKKYVEENERYKATVAVVGYLPFLSKAEAPAESEIKARYERDKAKLTVPEKRGIDYLNVTPAAMRAQVKIDDAQLKSYYQSHLDKFSTQAGQRRASHILIKTPPDATPAQIEAARKKAQEIYGKVKAGGDFAALARQFSEDTSAKSGGDLGWFSRQAMVKPFADAVFDECKAAGDVVGPVQSQFGFHVIKLTGIGGAPKPFDEVKEQVKQIMLFEDPGYKDKAEKMFQEASKALEEAKDDAAIQALVKKYGLAVDSLKPFAKDDPMGVLGRDPKIEAAVFKAEQGQWQPSQKLRDGVLRFKVTTIQPAHPASLDEVKDKLSQEIRKEKAMVLARTAAFELAASAKDAATLEAAAKKDGYQVQQSGSLKAADPVPVAGKVPELGKALLAANAGTLVGPTEVPSGWAVAFVTEHTHADLAKLAKEKDTFARNLRQQEARQMIDDYVDREMKALTDKHEVRFNDDVIERLEPAAQRS
jgi:peptidyl-prolyl cis-trans isomerase D